MIDISVYQDSLMFSQEAKMAFNSKPNTQQGNQGDTSKGGTSKVQSQQASTAGKVASALGNPVDRQVERTSAAFNALNIKKK